MPSAVVGISACFRIDGGERHLVAGPNGNFRVREIAAARNIDYVDAKWFKAARQFDGLFEVPAAFLPVRGGDAKE